MPIQQPKVLMFTQIVRAKLYLPVVFLVLSTDTPEVDWLECQELQSLPSQCSAIIRLAIIPMMAKLTLK